MTLRKCSFSGGQFLEGPLLKDVLLITELLEQMHCFVWITVLYAKETN